MLNKIKSMLAKSMNLALKFLAREGHLRFQLGHGFNKKNSYLIFFGQNGKLQLDQLGKNILPQANRCLQQVPLFFVAPERPLLTVLKLGTVKFAPVAYLAYRNVGFTFPEHSFCPFSRISMC